MHVLVVYNLLERQYVFMTDLEMR